MNSFQIGAAEGIKLAAQRDEKLTESEKRKALLYGGGGVAAGTGANALLMHKLEPSKIKWDQDTADRMMRHMKLKNVDVRGVPGIKKTDIGWGVHRTGQPFVQTPHGHGAEFLAHELGHVPRKKLNYHRTRIHGFATRSALPMAGAIGGAAMALKGKRGSWTTRLAPAVALGSHVPLLFDEGRASLRGYRALKAMGTLSRPELRTARRKLLHAFGTYGTGALAATAPAAAIAALRWKKKKED